MLGAVAKGVGDGGEGGGEVGPVTSQSAGPSLGSRDHKFDNELETATTVTKVQHIFFLLRSTYQDSRAVIIKK